MTGLDLYVSLRRAGVPSWRALEQAGLTEGQLRKHLRRDLPLALELLTLYGRRRRQTNAWLLYRVADAVLSRREKEELAELTERWIRWRP